MATDAAMPEAKPLFTAKEEKVMQVAWLCLKTGPPEVDITRLVKLGEFNTPKTAVNTWGVIKKKLLSMPEAQDASFADKADGASVEATKPAANSTKKRGRKTPAAVDDEEAETKTTTSKKRKSPAKKVKAGKDTASQSDSGLSAIDEELLGDAPAKKKRKSPVKKAKTEEIDTTAGTVEDTSEEEAKAVDETSSKDAEIAESTSDTETQVKEEANAADV